MFECRCMPWAGHTHQARVVFEYSPNGNIALDSYSWSSLTNGLQNIQAVVVRMAHHAVVADVTARVLDIEEKRQSLEEEQAAERAWEAVQDDVSRDWRTAAASWTAPAND